MFFQRLSSPAMGWPASWNLVRQRVFAAAPSGLHKSVGGVPHIAARLASGFESRRQLRLIVVQMVKNTGLKLHYNPRFRAQPQQECRNRGPRGRTRQLAGHQGLPVMPATDIRMSQHQHQCAVERSSGRHPTMWLDAPMMAPIEAGKNSSLCTPPF